VIATAEPTTYHGNFTRAPRNNTWYPQALANSLARTDLSTTSDIRAYFNSSVGTPQCLPDKGWYYGLDGNAQPDQFDFVTVVLRELAHGLGFITTVNFTDGKKHGGYDDVLSLNLQDVSTGKLWSQMTDAERLAAMRSNGNLRWTGDNVKAVLGGEAPMYAPPEINPDFSVSNWDGSRYTGSVTIEAGSTTALITVNPIDDGLEEVGKTVILSLNPDPAYTVDAPSSDTVTIADNDAAPPTVTITATTPNASETGPTVGEFTVTRSVVTASSLIVNYKISGTAINGTDYTVMSGSVTIEAGLATAPIDVNPISDAVVEGTETVILTLRDNPAYVVATPDSAMVTITDGNSSPLPTVSIAATTPDASETGPAAGQFTVTRTGSTAGALTVNYSIGGTATNTTDYATLSGSVIIDAGSETAVIDVTPVDDTKAEASETVLLTLSTNSVYTVIYPSSATVTIADNDSTPPLPTVSIAAMTPNASETGPTPGQFTVTRDGDTAAPLDVNYQISGTATNGTDYAILLGSVTIPGGSASVTIAVTPVDDALEEGTEFVVLSLLENSTYTLGSPSVATVAIADNDSTSLPTVSIAATTPNASETGPTPGQFTVTRTGSNAEPLTVHYTIGGTATKGVDYTIDPHELVEPFYSIANHNVGLAFELLQDIGWNQEPAGNVRIVALDETVTEGATTAFVVYRAGPTDSQLTVHYKISGSAKNGEDYQTLDDFVVIPVGEFSAAITLETFLDANAKERDESVTITLLSDADYTLGSPKSATIKIQNNVPKFGTGNPPAGEAGVPYVFDLPISGGEEPYTVEVSKGALPAGLVPPPFGSTQITGTPTLLAKSASFTIKVTDIEGASVSKNYKITILKTVAITTTKLRAGKMNVAYSAALKASGGKTPYTWSVDVMPPGLALNSSTGAITGTPTASGTWNPIFQVTDALGATASSPPLTLIINN